MSSNKDVNNDISDDERNFDQTKRKYSFDEWETLGIKSR